MTKLFSRMSTALIAVAIAVSAAPVGALAAIYTIDAPASKTITESALIQSTNGVANNSADVAALAASNSIQMSLIGDGVEPGLSQVRISPTQVTGAGTVQLWVHESASDKWYDTVITGWGPATGFPITADYNEGVTVVAVADVPDSYSVHYEVVDVITSDVVASGDTTLTVSQQTSAVVSNEQEFNDALADTDITDITLDSDFTIDATVDVNREVSIDGNGHTISVSDSITGTALLITGDNVSVVDLTVDAAGKIAKGGSGIQAIQAYVAENVTLSNVTAKNAGKSGIMVNGSTVTVDGVTTSGNTWHGINVDQGSGVTTPAVLTVAGTSSHIESGPAIYIDDAASGSVTGAVAQYTQVTVAPSTAYYLSTVDTEEELTAALSNSAIGTITLGGDITTSTTVAISRAVALDGNGRTISANFVKTSSSNNSVILITASNVTISDITVDGETASNNLHGINIYVATGITLNDVEAKNTNTGINVNGSTVSASNITTSNSAWHGINVDQGSGVTTTAALTINGTSNHTEDEEIPHIWVDDISLPGIVVIDVSSQYESEEVGWVDGATPRTGRSYILREVETNNGGGGGSRRNNSDDSDESDSPAGEVSGGVQGEVLGASVYNFATDLTIGSTGQDVVELQTMLIAAGYLKIPTPTGYFGPLTAAAVKLYQTAHGVPSTGYVGPLTRAQLNLGSSPGADEAKLIALKSQLEALLQQLEAIKNK